MSAAVVKWLQQQFSGVQDVKFATTRPDSTAVFQYHDADLVVGTWMGGRLYVYFIHMPPKARDLRSTLKSNTRDNIGTLFVVNSALLPAHGTTGEISEWQEGLRALNDGWIYSYGLYDDEVSLSQVHLEETPVQDQYRCWHLTDFEIESVAVRRRTVPGKNSFKGDWVIGDIASPRFKRRINHERVHQRYHYRTRNTRQTNGRTPPQPKAGELIECYRILEVQQNASREEVKAAYRRMAMHLHPDVSALPRVESERRFKQLNEAYETIKEHRGWK